MEYCCGFDKARLHAPEVMCQMAGECGSVEMWNLTEREPSLGHGVIPQRVRSSGHIVMIRCHTTIMYYVQK